MITIFVHHNGVTRVAKDLDPAWLAPDSPDKAGSVKLWVDFSDPTPEEGKLLATYFHFHELSIEDALGEVLHPKIEPYNGYLYVVLHGIDFQASEHAFTTHEVDFFLHPRYLVTVHDGFSRSIDKLHDVCPRNDFVLGEGTDALLHRILDAMVDNYSPEVDKLEQRLDEVEHRVFERPSQDDIKRILSLKRDVASLRRVVMPQRDVVGRLARREFPIVGEQTAYRFRDVYDHLVRLSEEANIFHDRLMGLLDAHLSFASNRLNEVMKVLAIISTIFMPLTVLTGMYGMNVSLPHLPGGEGAQFWWIIAIMSSISGGLLWLFNRKRWW
jgi:magnesium transporter